MYDLVTPLTIWGDLEASADQVFGSGAGGWALGAIVAFALMFPIGLALFVKGGGTAGQMFVLMVSAFVIVFNVGVGWWDTWTLVFIALIIGFAWKVLGTGSSAGGL